MRVVAGLGNPGERYRRTRHNVGFRVVDVLAARAGLRPEPGDPERGLASSGSEPAAATDAWAAEASFGGERVLLVKPLSFMNRSGEPIARLLARESLTPRELLVIVDDVAIALGVVRVRERGSPGGHNGLRSIAEALGSDEFPRVRIGVRTGELPPDLAPFVLSVPPPEEEASLAEAVERAADAVSSFLVEGAAAAMNRFNGIVPGATPAGESGET